MILGLLHFSFKKTKPISRTSISLSLHAMAPKLKTLPDSPAISSSSPEEDRSSSEEDRSSSEENTPPAQTPLSPPSKKPQSSTKTPPQQETSSKEKADSETEPEPVSQKPNPALSLPPKSTKRASKSAHEGAKTSKRAKVADDSSKKPEDAKRGLFERLWSEEDEIALLNGVIKFEVERGMKVSEDVAGFYEFIQNSLHCEVKLLQMKDKIRKLKKRFVNKKMQSGVEAKFAKSHDQDCFDLSMKIWGSDGASSSGPGLAKSSGVKSRAEKKNRIIGVGGDNKLDSSRGRHFLRSCMGAVNMEEVVMESALEMFEGEEKTELEDKWMKYYAEQLELYVKGLDLLKEQSLRLLASRI